MVWKMVSPQQLQAAIAADKSNLQSLIGAAQHAQSADRRSGAGNDTTVDVQALETARNNMLAEKVKLAQTIMGNLSSAQRQQVASFVSQYQQLEQSQQQARALVPAIQ
jgi:hypothetical protein